MNDLQDAICDRLVGTPIRRGWVGGPLHIAAQVIQPDFELAEAEHARRQGQLVSAMNWPRLFCFTFYGANAGLEGEEDRRALAIGLFRRVSPRKKQLRRSPWLYAEIAGWMVKRVHPLVCSKECPLAKAVNDFPEQLPRGTRKLRSQAIAGLDVLDQCPAHDGAPHTPVQMNSSPGHHALSGCRFFLCALEKGHPDPILTSDSARESARTIAKVRGVEGALALCLEVAEDLGIGD